MVRLRLQVWLATIETPTTTLHAKANGIETPEAMNFMSKPAPRIIEVLGVRSKFDGGPLINPGWKFSSLYRRLMFASGYGFVLGGDGTINSESHSAHQAS